jgi:outer membrane translocation and assembly module TamA
VGLLRLDLGFPLNKREGDKSFRLHFSLGQAF